ncbi:prolyl 4-hydroxylase, partial [Biomphalaria pfeifferi]
MNAVARILVQLTFALTLVQGTSCDVMTSSIKIERMVKNEENLLQQLKTFIDDQLDRIKVMIQFFADRWLEIHMDNSTTQADLDHPNTILLVIKQFQDKYEAALGNNYDNFLQMLNKTNDLFLPDDDDFMTALLALVRLQNTYNLSVSNMISGDYLDYKGPPLSSIDAFFIGLVAYGENDFNQSLEWWDASLSRQSDRTYSQWKGPTRLDTATVKALMGETYFYLGKGHEAKSLYNEAKMLDPNNSIVLRLENALKNPTNEKLEDVNEDYNYTKLCRLQHQLYDLAPNDVRLVCRFRETLLPYYRFQEELLSISPFVSLIYKFTTDTESEFFKTAVRNKMRRGQVIGSDKRSITTKQRTGNVGWVKNEDSEVADKLSKKIAHVTGLNTSENDQSAEPFQVVNYGLAGHYFLHTDAEEDKLERIMTFLIYLSDVEMGGATVFPKVGISVTPQKNMALMWYNFNTAYKEDEMTLHAGCSVLIGQKW